MSRQHFTLTLFHKALILVAVPLLFELVLLTKSIQLMDEAQKEVQLAKHAEMVVDKTNGLIQSFHDVTYAFLVYDAKTNEVNEQRLEQQILLVPKRVTELRSLVSESNSHLEIMEQVEQKFNLTLNTLIINKRKIKAQLKLDLGDAFAMRKALKEMESQLDMIIADYDTALKKNPEAVALQKQIQVRQLLLLGMISSIVIALILVAVFHQSTAKRLKSLMDNITSLSKREPLKPTLDGNDEIARIDGVFHEMANALNEAARKKQEFVDMISHDLRTPLSAVQTSLAVLGSGTWGQLTDTAQHKVLTAEDNIRRSISLINNLLDLERMESGKLEIRIKDQPLMPILEICVESISQLAERRNIAIKLPTTNAIVQVDDERLSQVVLNLLGNAIKFSPEGSAVTISVVDKPPWIEVRIMDQGMGIPTDYQKLIFERFRQAPGDDKAKAQGTGLGLAICKMIIDAHSGTIGVESEEGKGSTFWFSIPSA